MEKKKNFAERPVIFLHLVFHLNSGFNEHNNQMMGNSIVLFWPNSFSHIQATLCGANVRLCPKKY